MRTAVLASSRIIIKEDSRPVLFGCFLGHGKTCKYSSWDIWKVLWNSTSAGCTVYSCCASASKICNKLNFLGNVNFITQGVERMSENFQLYCMYYSWLYSLCMVTCMYCILNVCMYIICIHTWGRIFFLGIKSRVVCVPKHAAISIKYYKPLVSASSHILALGGCMGTPNPTFTSHFCTLVTLIHTETVQSYNMYLATIRQTGHPHYCMKSVPGHRFVAWLWGYCNNYTYSYVSHL